MTARKPRHKVVERYRKGAAFYDVTRQSWDDGQEVTLRSFLTGAEAYKWVEDIEQRQDAVMAAVDE